jgi:hypothetical protein
MMRRTRRHPSIASGGGTRTPLVATSLAAALLLGGCGDAQGGPAVESVAVDDGRGTHRSHRGSALVVGAL